MTEKDKILLEKICEKRKWPKDYLYKNYVLLQEENGAMADQWLRGHLTMPSTAKAVFGEGKTFHSIYTEPCDDTIPPMEIIKDHYPRFAHFFVKPACEAECDC